VPERTGRRQDPDAERKARWVRSLAHVHREDVAPRIDGAPPEARDHLREASLDLIQSAQLVRVVETAKARGDHDTAATLEELSVRKAVEGLGAVEAYLVGTGVADVIEYHRAVIASELEPDDLPAEDLEALRRCGVSDPWAEAWLSIERLRRCASMPPPPEELRYASAVGQALTLEGRQNPAANPGQMRRRSKAAGDERSATKPAAKPKRRWFKGFGAIVKGGVLLTVDGGLLIAGAPITAAEPMTAAGIVGSFAMGFNDVASGIGDLRGE